MKELRHLVRATDYFDVNTEHDLDYNIDDGLAEYMGVDEYPIIYVCDIKKFKEHLKKALEQLEQIAQEHKNSEEEYIYLGD